MSQLSHITATGEAHMVDVSEKSVTTRVAVAEGRVVMKPETLALCLSGDAKKGDVLGTARIAGIMAAKKTHELIPLCHPLLISKVTLDLTPDDKLPGVHVRAEVKVGGQTGVEMEALTAASVALLTLYDMAKALDRAMVIGDIRLLEIHLVVAAQAIPIFWVIRLPGKGALHHFGFRRLCPLLRETMPDGHPNHRKRKKERKRSQ